MMPGRFERKYRMPDQDRAYLMEYWRPFLRPAPYTDERARYPVLSQYFDTPDLRFHREKHDGIGVRRKVRLRTYGTRFREGAVSFLEIKRRTNDAVDKVRLQLPGFDRSQRDPGRWSTLGVPGVEPFCASYEYYRLRPSAQVLYIREAYESVLGDGFRITFDSLLMGLHPEEELSRETFYDRSRAILPETEVILEIKGRETTPGWVQRGIRWCELQQETVPKYVLAVEALNLVRLTSGAFA